MPKKAENPFKMGYDPELDTITELDPNAALYYITIISILRWMIELGSINIKTKVLSLSSHVRSSSACHGPHWSEIKLQIGV